MLNKCGMSQVEEFLKYTFNFSLKHLLYPLSFFFFELKMKKQAKIYHLNKKSKTVEDYLKDFDRYLLDGNFKLLIKQAGEAIKKYPTENVFLYISKAVAHSNINEEKTAIDILLNAKNIFRDEKAIHFYLAKFYDEQNKIEAAKSELLKAIELTPPRDKNSKSDFLNELAVLFWKEGNNKEAIKILKSALKENPTNLQAKENLEFFSMERNNKPGTDLLGLFLKVQSDKYFASTGKSSFSSEKETNRILDIIFKKWNNEIAAKFDEINKLSKQKQEKFLREVEIDFSLNSPYKQTKTEEGLDLDIEEIMDEINNYLDFLPADSLVILPLLEPLIIKAGMKKARILEIITKGNPSDEEKDILQWAVDVGFTLMDSNLEDDEAEKELIFEEAVEIAADYIPRTKSRDILIKTAARLYEISNYGDI